MQLTTKSRYALRALIELAASGESGPVSRAHLASAQDISADYMAQLFRQLQAAGLVHSVKGPGGGYTLGRPATEISVGDIVRAVEGPIELVSCEQGDGHDCARAEDCAARHVWRDASAALAQALDRWTLAQVVENSGAHPEIDLS